MNPRLRDRLERRVEKYLARMERVKRFIEKDTNEEGEDLREWMEQFCEGIGMDICCGYFPVSDDVIGVDSDTALIGVDLAISGEALTTVKNGELDYIVTNYFDVFTNPIAVLQEWNRALRQNGILAISCANAELYENAEGALSNPRRLMTYTEKPVKHLLARAGFKDITVEKRFRNLLISAYKA